MKRAIADFCVRRSNDRGIDDRGRVEKRDRAFVAGFSREQKKKRRLRVAFSFQNFLRNARFGPETFRSFAESAPERRRHVKIVFFLSQRRVRSEDDAELTHVPEDAARGDLRARARPSDD